MRRTICICLFACLAVGLAVPVPESTSPDNEQDLKNLILNAKPEDNDISVLPAKNQVTEESGDTVMIDSAAVTEKENEDQFEITDDTTESYPIASPEEIEGSAIAPKVNQTDLPIATDTLEPTHENTPVVIDEELREQQILDIVTKIGQLQETYKDDSQVFRITEDPLNGDGLVDVIREENQETFEDDSQGIRITEDQSNEDDLVDAIPYDNQETFEGDSQVIQITEDQPNDDDLVDAIPYDNQETFDDEPMIPVFGEEIPLEGEQIVPEPNEQMPSEKEQEVIIVFDENSPYLPTSEEAGLFESEEDEEQNVFPGGEEIFMIEDSGIIPTHEEEEGSIIPNIGEEQMAPTYNDYQDDMAPDTNYEDDMLGLVPEDPYFSEEPFIHHPNDDSVFGSPFPPSVEGNLPVDVDDESESPVVTDLVITVPHDVSGNPFALSPPSEYFIPEEVSVFPENENDSFTDFSDIVMNEPIPMRNDNETPAMVDILMIKSKPLLSEGRPTIEVISTDIPQIPQRFVFGATLPVNGDQEPENSEIPEYTQEDGTFVNDSELPEQSGFLTPNMLARQPIIFPEEFVPKYNPPVSPDSWTEDNFYDPPRMQSQNTAPFEPFAYSSYSKYNSNRIPGPSYGSPALPFSPYGPSQDHSFSGPNPHQQNFVDEQSEDMNGMMNDDMQSQMPNTMPLSSTSDVTIFDYEDMQENEEPDHSYLTDDVPQNSRFSNFPNRFDTYMDSMMPTREDISQDFQEPNDFPLNFRNTNVDGENTDFNVFNAPFQTDRSQGTFQQTQQYDVRPSFSPYQSRYSMLNGDQFSQFDSRYPIVGQPNPFNSYKPFNFYYSPYDNYNLFRSPGLYSPQPVKRYSMNYRFNYPTPLW